MASVNKYRIDSARRASERADKLGGLVYKVAQIAFAVISFVVVVGMFAVIKGNQSDGYSDSGINWSGVWTGWAVLIGAWLAYSFALAMIALIGAVAQAKAESLGIQIMQLSDD